MIPSGEPETAAAAGIVSSAIRSTDPGDGNPHPHTLSSKDHHAPVIGCNGDDNNSDDAEAARSEEAVVVVVVGRNEGEATGGGKEGGAPAVVAPEELEEREAGNAFEEEEKEEDEVEEEEEEEEEPEALVSKTCSVRAIDGRCLLGMPGLPSSLCFIFRPTHTRWIRAHVPPFPPTDDPDHDPNPEAIKAIDWRVLLFVFMFSSSPESWNAGVP